MPSKSTLQKNINIDLDVVNKVWLWFEEIDDDSLDAILAVAEGDDCKVSMQHAFDYERLENNQWLLHIDVGIKVVPVARILVRTSFQYEAEEKFAFRHEILEMMNSTAIQHAVQAFNEQCKSRNIEYVVKQEEFLKYSGSLSVNMIEQYNGYRKKNDECNRELYIPGLAVTPGTHQPIVAKSAFIILDEVLFYNKAFNRENNRDEFEKIIPLPLYQTLKLKLLNSEKESVQLTWFHTILLSMLLDASLQIMIGPHEETILPSITKRGLTEACRKILLKEGTALLAQMKKHLQKSKTKVTNLEKYYDWNTIFQ